MTDTNNQPQVEITLGRGFKLTFANGWTASVQFGPSNYCAMRDQGGHAEIAVKARSSYASPDAELCAWRANDPDFYVEPENAVDGIYEPDATPDRIAAFLANVAALAPYTGEGYAKQLDHASRDTRAIQVLLDIVV